MPDINLLANVANTGNQILGNASLSSIDSKLPSQISGGLPVYIANTVSTTSAGTTFIFSTINSTTTPLIAGGTFTGGVEDVRNQPALSINLTCDTAFTLTINQFIDAAGLNRVSSWVISQNSNTHLNQAWSLNGNYVQLILTNNGSTTTTNLNLNTAYGSISPVSQLGNNPISIDEINGVSIPAGVLPISLTGVPGSDFAGIDLISELTDSLGDLSLNTKTLNPVKTDAYGATIISDAPLPQTFTTGGASNICVLDTTGYNSISLQLVGTFAGTVSFFWSNDKETWVAASGSSATAPLVPITTATATGLFVFPVMGTYFRAAVTAYTSGLFTTIVALRQQQAPLNQATAPVNMATIAGTAPVTGGVAGMLAVGGNIAIGSAPTANPILVGGVDQGSLNRRFLTDTNGYLSTTGPLTLGYQYGQFNVTYSKFNTVLSSSTVAQSTFNPLLMGGLTKSGQTKFNTLDADGSTYIRQSLSTSSDQSVNELLTQLVGAQRATVHLLGQVVALCRGNIDPPPSDEADSLIGEYINTNNNFINLTNN